MNQPERRSAGSALLLLAGAILGLVLAASGMFESISVPTDSRSVAQVNDWEISRADFSRAADALGENKRIALSIDRKRDLLDRLIEEKLLLQRGLEMGLVETEPTVRKAIATAMIQTITAEVSAIEPDEQDLQSFYSANTAYFAQPARLRVRQLLFRDNSAPAALRRAEQTVAGLRSAELSLQQAEQIASPQALQLPDALLPPHKLRDYIGPELTDLAATMNSGDVSDPQASPGGYLVLVVIDNQPAEPLQLDAIRARVIAEYQRRASDQALRDYLAMLRAEADISIAPDALQINTEVQR